MDNSAPRFIEWALGAATDTAMLAQFVRMGFLLKDKSFTGRVELAGTMDAPRSRTSIRYWLGENETPERLRAAFPQLTEDKSNDNENT